MIAPELLKETVLGTGLTSDQLAVLATRGDGRTFKAGEAIIPADEKTFPLIVVLTGGCEVLGVMGDVVNKCLDGMLLGEVSFLDKQPRSARAVATTECRVAVFPEDLNDWLRAEHPDILARVLENISKVLCMKLRQATRQIDAGLV